MFKVLKRKIPFAMGFSLTEILVALVLGSLISVAAYNYFKKQERKFVVEKLSGDVQSISRIAFFLIARDIRRAGSNPAQAVSSALSGQAAAPIPLPVAEPELIQIQADLNGDGDVLDTDEDITYQFLDSPDDDDAVKDHIKRDPSVGNQIVIDNVQNFHLSYILASGSEVEYPSPTSLIRKVRIQLTVNAGRNNPETGEPITQTYETVVKLRNFQ